MDFCMQWWVLGIQAFGKNIWFAEYLQKYQFRLFSQKPRITNHFDNPYSFKSIELSTIFATTPSQWTGRITSTKLDIFYHKMLLLPFNRNGQTSLFVVICPGHIREYSNKTYGGSRPCILHLDPNESTSSSNDHHVIGERLLSCLHIYASINSSTKSVISLQYHSGHLKSWLVHLGQGVIYRVYSLCTFCCCTHVYDQDITPRIKKFGRSH